MGIAQSTIPNIRPGVVVTLDALGTLYKFREPISKQYIKVAQRCGLQASIEEDDLDKAFRKSFKDISTEYPNYGKDQLSSPRAWWKTVVNDAFRQVVDESKIPDHLGEEMYDHFTSSAAYELYPDVKPFFASMRELKQEWSKRDDPPIMVGAISNSDPRVRNVFQSLGLRVGIDRMLSPQDVKERTSRVAIDYHNVMKSPWHDVYNPLNDIDFLATSYQAGYEKPHSGIFAHAQSLAAQNFISKLEQQQEDHTPSLKNLKNKLALPMQLEPIQRSMYIHIGDEYKKDYLGAEDAGFEAMHLVREGEGQHVVDGTTVVSDLEEAAAAIRVLARANFEGT